MRLLLLCSMFALMALTFAIDRVVFAAPSPADESLNWYEPKETDFKAAYDRDKANMSQQTFKDYWGWVQSFYAGNLLDSGWTKRCKDLLAGVRKEETQASLRMKLNAIGKSIAAEWAKANAERKIDTTKLVAWGQRLEDARKKDAGDGDVLKKEIETIAGEVERNIAGKP